jgi:vancomycin permeability regulator SanA
MKRVFQRLVRGAGLLVAGAALCSMAGIALLAWQIDRLGQKDDVCSADVIVVLGARVQADGQPGPDLSSRTNHAVALWHEGYAPFIICSGGFKNERLSAAAVCRKEAVRQGVPAGRVFLADGTENTAEDARAAVAVMGANG